MNEDEAYLVQQAKQDPTAFGQLYDRYVERIYAYAQRETGDTATAQDVVSATFEKALQKLPQYEWRGTNFGAWLYKIARNEMRMQYRRQKWFAPLLDRFFSDVNVEQAVQQQEQEDAMLHALKRLPTRDQEVLRLHFFEDLSHAEISVVLNCSTRNVAVRLHRALKRLRRKLDDSAQEVLIDVTS